MNTYTDILYTPRPVSQRHAAMSLTDRAAQFAPFAALSGYEDVIWETGRLTQPETELTDSAKQELNSILLWLADRPGAWVRAVYFQPDRRKAGGAYRSICGCVREVDRERRLLCFCSGEHIAIDSIRRLEPENEMTLD